ncbi:hypothetical protein ACFOLF_12335 [Paenibacillus sepulcri]|uniref:hypothetical protein n=1 Tax=Paenibacillus sepulcri TaxID=359917 RepID=UPI0035EBA366
MNETMEKLQKGDKVVMHTCVESKNPKYAGKIWNVTSDQFEQSGHFSVMLEGFSGSFATEFLQRVQINPVSAMDDPSEIEDTLDLGRLVEVAMIDIKKSGLVQKAVRGRLEATIKDVIDDVFKSYGDFGKELKEHVKSSLNVNFNKLDLPEYNTLVAHTVKEKLNELTYSLGVEKLKTQMDTLLADIKPEYKLSEIIEEWLKEQNDDGDKDDEYCTVIVETKSYGSQWIYIDEEADKEKYECNIKMLVRHPEGTISNLKIGNMDINAKSIMWGLHDIEGKLFTIYAHGSKLIVDEDDVETGYPNSYED